MSKPSDLVQGTLVVLVLKILELEPLHGWALSQRLKQVSGDVLQVSEGSLYPALHKLEQQGWITAEWKASENNRRAKFYSLTRLGRKHLARETADWSRLSAAISQVLGLGRLEKCAVNIGSTRSRCGSGRSFDARTLKRNWTKRSSSTWSIRLRFRSRRAFHPGRRAPPRFARSETQPW